MTPQFKIAAITDEFSPDLSAAMVAMLPIGMLGAELRVVFGKNVMDLDAGQIKYAKDRMASKGMKCVSIASPLLKCVLDGGPAVDTRFQQDVFASKHTFADQPRLAEHAFSLAEQFGAKIVRVFSYWRTVDPNACFDAVCKALSGLADQAKQHDLVIGLENEHACNIATAAESAKVLKAVDHPNLKLVWDPANALVAGEIPFPDGYGLLPANRIVHVHVKDCHMDGHKPVWGPLGTRSVDWKGQLKALKRDGYDGWLSLETHWPGPGGDKIEASTICGWNLRGLSCLEY
ncbi:MAG TPA: sugar phosphate isomerase/epimerase family protein [Bryobacteraceae bacterium]|jgi:hydroxypyruvate isomerase